VDVEDMKILEHALPPSEARSSTAFPVGCQYTTWRDMTARSTLKRIVAKVSAAEPAV
jgi:hypothetical protein